LRRDVESTCGEQRRGEEHPEGEPRFGKITPPEAAPLVTQAEEPFQSSSSGPAGRRRDDPGGCGEAAFPSCFSRALVRCAARQYVAAPAELSVSPLGLSRREQQLVELVRVGLTNKEIATRLNLAEPTIKNHVHRILRKVGVSDRLTLVERCHARTRVS
jgi:DNA-binding CsgD family transcriptional regulator